MSAVRCPLRGSGGLVVALASLGVACSGDTPAEPPSVDNPPEETTPSLVLTVDDAPNRIVGEDSVGVPVTIDRTAIDGTVDVIATRLPVGVTATPLTLPGGIDSGVVTLSADAGADVGGPFTVELSATSDGVTDERRFDVFVAGAPGSLDDSFSFDGVVDLAVTSDQAFGSDLLIDHQRRIVVVGGTSPPDTPWLARLQPDGLLDPAFAMEGQQLGIGQGTVLQHVAIDLKGRLYVQGLFDNATDGNPDDFIAALDPDGVVDETFGSVGIGDFVAFSRTELLLGTERIFAVRDDTVVAFRLNGTPDAAFSYTPDALEAHFAGAIDAEDRLIVAGDPGPGSSDWVFERLDATGTRDPTFGDEGIATLQGPPGASFAFVLGLRATAIGTFAVGLTDTSPAPTQTPVVIKLDADGQPDPNFGDAGVAALPTEDGAQFDWIAVQSDGRVLIAGQVDGQGRLRRLSPDGTLDPTFGDDGEVRLVDDPFGLVIELDAGRATLLLDGETPDAIRVVRYWL